MRTMLALLALLALITILPRAVVAQDLRSALGVGARVRISAPALGGAPRLARVVASTADTVVVQPADSRDFTVAVPLVEIDRVEVPTGRRPRKARFAVIGLIAGTVGGGIIGAASYSDPCVKEPAICAGWFHETAQTNALSGALDGAAFGALGGVVLGQLWQREVWTTLPRTRTVRVRLAPTQVRLASGNGSRVIGLRLAVGRQ